MMDTDLQYLLEACLSGEIDDEKISPVLERLRTDESFRSSFVAEVAMLGQLKAVQSSEPHWLKLGDAIAAKNGVRTSDNSFESRVMEAILEQHRDGSPRARSGLPLFLITGIAVAAAFVAFVFWPDPASEPQGSRNHVAINEAPVRDQKTIDSERDMAVEMDPNVANSIAVLTRSANVRWGGYRKPSVGDALDLGDLVLEHGTIQIDFFAGARLLLQAPANIELRSADEVFIREGAANCTVTEMGKGFRIVTADMEVIDLGTSFSISVKKGQQPEVHVVQGSVEIKSSNPESLELRERQAIRMGDAGPENVPFSPERFPQTSDLVEQQNLRNEQRFQQWAKSSEKWRSDPSVILHYTFQETDPSALELSNRADDSSRATNGVVIGCQWDRGRWPEKRALVYRSSEDRVLFQVPGAFDELTFMAWARVDALTQQTTSLMMNENPSRRALFSPLNSKAIEDARERLSRSKVKTVRWELARKGGNVMFNVAHDHGGRLEYETCSVPNPSARSAHWGEWACLAVTCDTVQRRVVHYWNGKQIGICELEHAEPLLLDFMELGNFGVPRKEMAKSKGLSRRRFYGAFDEVLIASRTLAPDEIKTFWLDGRP